MPTYRGNLGNLLQHWVLADLTLLLRDAVGESGTVCFIDAYAMSPYAVRCERPGPTAADFDRVASHLPGQSTAYECAWLALASHGRCKYPSSAALIRAIWHGPLHLLLCELDGGTANEIAEWRGTLGEDTSSELHRGDWQARFRQGLPTGYCGYVVSFDPYMIDCQRPPRSENPGEMRPGDILRAGAAALDLSPDRPLILQLSTYSASNNSQEDVIAAVEPILNAAEVELAATVRADENMMSLVFARNLPTVRDAELPRRFTSWLDQARRGGKL